MHASVVIIATIRNYVTLSEGGGGRRINCTDGWSVILTRSRWRWWARGCRWPGRGAQRLNGRHTSCCRSPLWIQRGGLKERARVRELIKDTVFTILFSISDMNKIEIQRDVWHHLVCSESPEQSRPTIQCTDMSVCTFINWKRMMAYASWLVTKYPDSPKVWKHKIALFNRLVFSHSVQYSLCFHQVCGS